MLVTSNMPSWEFKNWFCWHSDLVNFYMYVYWTQSEGKARRSCKFLPQDMESGSKIQCVEVYNFLPCYAFSFNQPTRVSSWERVENCKYSYIGFYCSSREKNKSVACSDENKCASAHKNNFCDVWHWVLVLTLVLK